MAGEQRKDICLGSGHLGRRATCGLRRRAARGSRRITLRPTPRRTDTDYLISAALSAPSGNYGGGRPIEHRSIGVRWLLEVPNMRTTVATEDGPLRQVILDSVVMLFGVWMVAICFLIIVIHLNCHAVK